MEVENQPPEVLSRRARRPALGHPRVEPLLDRLVAAGASLSQIRDALAQDCPEGPGITVSRTAIAQKLERMGLKTAGTSFKALATQVSDGAVAVARRPIEAGEVRAAQRKGQRRVPSWLSPYKTEIGRLMGEGLIYCEIWDALKEANPMEPRFQIELSDSAKSARIANFKHREAKKAESRAGRKAMMLKKFSESQPTWDWETRTKLDTAETAKPEPGFNASRPGAQSNQGFQKPVVQGGRAALPSAAQKSANTVAEALAEKESLKREADPEQLAAALEKLGPSAAAPKTIFKKG